MAGKESRQANRYTTRRAREEGRERGGWGGGLVGGGHSGLQQIKREKEGGVEEERVGVDRGRE